jgi:hypothetical protein
MMEKGLNATVEAETNVSAARKGATHGLKVHQHIAADAMFFKLDSTRRDDLCDDVLVDAALFKMSKLVSLLGLQWICCHASREQRQREATASPG